MKSRDDISNSQIFNRIENNINNNSKTLETNTRPISAILKRPDSKIKINHSYLNNNPAVAVSSNIKPNNFISAITEINQKRLNYSSTRPKSTKITLEKERLYEDTIHLKNNINDLKKEISSLKSENHKYGLDINKKEKIIEEILIDSQNNIFNSPLNESKSISKARETHYIIQIKKQFKELKNEYKSKCIELDNVKKNIKLTKFNEVGIELKTYLDELSRIKSLYLVVCQQNEINEKKLFDFDNIHQNYTQQQYLILSLQDNLMKYENEIRFKTEEVLDLKNKLDEKNNKIKKLSCEIKIINQINQQLTKDKKTVSDVNAIKAKLDKQLTDLNKELIFYKDLAEKKDRRLREAESNLKSSNDQNNKNNNSMQFNIQSIKRIQENPEDKTDKTILLLRSKLTETISNYEKILKKNKILEEKVNQIENQYEIQDNNCKNIFYLN